MRHILLLLALTLTIEVLAQERPPSNGKQPSKVGYGKIEGVVLDPENQPIPFATIALIHTTTGKTTDGTIADESGKFSIKTIPEGSYKVSISFIGYQKLEQSPFEITGKGESYDLGKLKLEFDTQELNEVLVEGKRELMEEKIDRLIYNAEQDATTSGGDATDVLRRVPLLSVDLDGNVSLRGSSNVKVLIDNKPSTISASSISDALKQIPADQIKSVEVITSPSARYDAEGTGGIINIITKKNNLQGISVGVNSSAGLRGSNMGVNAAYRKGRFGLTLGGNGRAGYNIKGDFKNQQSLKNEAGDVLSITNQKASTLTNILFGRYNLGMDYEFNQYNWVSASVQFGVFNFTNWQNHRLSETYQEDVLTASSLQDVKMSNLSNNVDASLNFLRTFEAKGRELSILTLYSENDRTNDFENKTRDPESNDLVSGEKNDNDSYNREITVQVDYVHPIGDKHLFEVGGKNILRQVSSDYQYYSRGADGVYTPVETEALSNAFDYDQNVTAGYLSYKVELIQGLSAMIGGRYEYTTIHAKFSNESDLSLPSYGVLVPSIHLQKKLGTGKSLKAGYSRRIQRPSLQYLNPSINASNPKNISQGNPNLAPEYTDNFELSYSTFFKSTSLNFSAFMRNTSGSIQEVREILGQDTIYTSYQNIGEQDAYGLSIFANVRIGSKLMLNGGVDSYYAVLTNNVADPLYNASNRGFVISGRVFGDYKVNDKWAFQFFGFFRGKQVQLQGYQTSFYIYSLSLNHSLKDDRGSIGFGAENFVGGKMKMTTDISTPLIDQYSTNVMKNMSFKVNFSYKFGKLSMSPSRKKKRQVDNSDLKEGDSGNGMM